MSRIWLSLGSNIDRERNIRAALHDLQAEFGALLISRIYESEAVGFAGDASITWWWGSIQIARWTN